MKTCLKCKIEKSLEEYYFVKRGNRPMSDCKQCTRLKVRQWRLDNPEKFIAQSRARYQAKREDYLKRANDYRIMHPEARRANHLLRRYGLTPEDYQALLDEQHGQCAICGREPRGSRNEKNLHVDHDHDTGEVRGLLCISCNAAIGGLHNLELLESAVRYINRFTLLEAA